MISRMSSLLAYQLYESAFVNDDLGWATLNYEELWEFLYKNDLEGWVLTALKPIQTASGFKTFFLGIHSGTSFEASRCTAHRKQQIEQRVLKDLIETILKMLEPDFHDDSGKHRGINLLASALLRQLELDGYMFRNNKLYPLETSVIDEQAEQGYLELLIDNSGLSDVAVVKHHLELCEQAYLDSRWSDAISNSRNFFESILGQVGNALSMKNYGLALGSHIAARPVEVRKFLENEDFIDSVEREALAKIYGLISNTGSHPNMAHQDQARLMRHLALTFSQYALLQWIGYQKNNP